MYHLHFSSLPSTQNYLKENLSLLQKNHQQDILISTSEQNLGIGRNENKWFFYPDSLAMSFTMKPNPAPTLSSLEVGVLVALFLEKNFSAPIKLKWPNDLLTNEGKKCGGIISHYIDSETVIVGVGINLGEGARLAPNNDFKHGLGAVLPTLKLNSEDQKKISADFYSFLLKNRIALFKELQEYFYQFCAHKNHLVLINDEQSEAEGIFLGIGANGEALVEVNKNIRTFLSSSLTILN